MLPDEINMKRLGRLHSSSLLYLIYSSSSRKNEEKPQFILDHLVKERYPRFIDALGDMDDALCMVRDLSPFRPPLTRLSCVLSIFRSICLLRCLLLDELLLLAPKTANPSCFSGSIMWHVLILSKRCSSQ
jgi:hypothetical protein